MPNSNKKNEKTSKAPSFRGTMVELSRIFKGIVNPPAHHQFQDPKRAELQGMARHPIRGVNAVLDKAGIGLESGLKEAFVDQIRDHRQFGMGTSVGLFVSAIHEKNIANKINDPLQSLLWEKEQRMKYGLLTSEVEAKINMEINSHYAGALAHRAYGLVKQTINPFTAISAAPFDDHAAPEIAIEEVSNWMKKMSNR
ncbi:MAG: hypothetical protein A3F11_06675 [Gammaproteobacteria bacterium RIFCSPHIGHO2_12_FULL_37_14]|nr:MAG: hypothetical protein A3F11_06675 [Gammaproteobacteria bacterium RIFCSPHIGHO2_12_FULL_37_14]